MKTGYFWRMTVPVMALVVACLLLTGLLVRARWVRDGKGMPEAKPSQPETYDPEEDMDTQAAEIAWRELLAAMKNKDLSKMEELTTANGIKSLNKFIPEEERLETFQRLGRNWGEDEVRWQHERPLKGTLEANFGPQCKESTIIYVKTSKGWRLEKWFPGD